MNRLVAFLITVVTGTLLSQPALADVGVGVRAGTLGFGADFNVGLSESLNLRLGYNAFDYKLTSYEDSTDITYDGKLKIGAASALLDWHAFKGVFRFSLGVVSKGPRIDVVAKPTGGTYEINDHLYNATQIGSLTGKLEFGDSAAPYVGIGWGNAVGKNHRVTFQADVGAILTGDPTVTLNVTCGNVSAATCNQIRSDVNAEKRDIEDDNSGASWYPVIQLGFAVRF